MKVAVVTDSASDLPPDTAAAAGIRVVPLAVSFGRQSFRAGVDLSTDEFWRRVTAPDAPFPTTAASSPGAFQEAFEFAFADGADAVVCVDVAETLSGTIKSARLAAGMLPGREVHVVDSRSASMGVGLLALLAVELAAAGHSARDIAANLEARRADLDLYVALDTLAYLRKGGRLSGRQAAIGTLLSVKPIITVRAGLVEVAERPRTRTKARARVQQLLTARPPERLAVLYTPPADPLPFRDELVAQVPGGIAPQHLSVQLVGPSVGPHLGPGCLGGVVMYRQGRGESAQVGQA
jgi:DegV family protein with EDD domain